MKVDEAALEKMPMPAPSATPSATPMMPGGALTRMPGMAHLPGMSAVPRQPQPQ